MSRDQSLILLGQALTPEAPTYSTPVELHVAARLDPARLQRAFNAVLAAAPILQWRFLLPAGLRPDQATETRIEVVDVTAAAGTGATDAAEAALRRYRSRLLNLAERAWDSAVVLDGDRTIWLLNVHQIVADQRSLFEIILAADAVYTADARDLRRTAALSLAVPPEVLFGQPAETEQSRRFWQEWSATEFVPGHAAPARADARSAAYALPLTGDRGVRLHRIARSHWPLPWSAALLATMVAVVAQWHAAACPSMEWLCLGLPWHNRSSWQEHMIGPLMRVTPLQVPLRGSRRDAAAAIARGIMRGLAYRHYSPSNPPHRPLYDCLLNLTAGPDLTSFADAPAKLAIASSGSSIERLNIQVDAASMLVKQRADDRVPPLTSQLLDAVLSELDSADWGVLT